MNSSRRFEDDVTFEVEALLRREHQAACGEAQPPAAGIVWWRAARRLRDEQSRAAERPMTVVHAISGACAIGVAAALLQFLAPWLRQWINAAGALTRVLQFEMPTLNSPAAIMIGVVAAASLVFAPLALYVALSDD